MTILELMSVCSVSDCDLNITHFIFYLFDVTVIQAEKFFFIIFISVVRQ